MSLELDLNPPALRQGFFSLNTPRDIATLLQIDLGRLVYHLYKTDLSTRYLTFDIPKKAGGFRTISSPATALKLIQKKLNQVLREVYPQKPQVHGFLRGKSIISNALSHTGQRLVLNVDLEDFFPSINFGRIRGMLMAVPYNRNSTVASVLANICCFNNQLPQGAPTSPIISNMICAKMDSQLLRLAKKEGCSYTRYADDLTFSTSQESFPDSIATIQTNREGKHLNLGNELADIIEGNGFRINRKKVRLQRSDARQVVTGLVTNQFPNVKREFARQIRAMLHAWQTFGLEAAGKEFHEKYYRKHRNPKRATSPFKKVLQGRIAFFGLVRGKSNPAYIRFRQQLRQLAPELAPGIDLQPESISARKNSYFFRRDAIDFDQLSIDIEDEVGIHLRPYRHGDIVEGYVQKRPNGVGLLLCTEDKEPGSQNPYRFRKRILTPIEVERLGQIVNTHRKQPLVYQGPMGSAITRCLSAVVRVVVNRAGDPDSATGFVAGKPNLILTAAHVVNPEYLMIDYIEFGDARANCDIIYLDTQLDIAILKLDRDIQAPPIKIRHFLQMPQDRGMKCAAIGFPDIPGVKHEPDVRELTITGTQINYVLGIPLLALSVRLGPGMSGSPIIDEHHSLVGMVIGYPSTGEEKKMDEWTACGISCSEISPILEQVIAQQGK